LLLYKKIKKSLIFQTDDIDQQGHAPLPVDEVDGHVELSDFEKVIDEEYGIGTDKNDQSQNSKAQTSENNLKLTTEGKHIEY